MTWKEEASAWLGMLMLVLIGVATGLYIERSHSAKTEEPITAPPSMVNKTVINHVFTDNMKDCQEKGGDYHLSIRSNGEVRYETCGVKIEKDYQSDKTN